MKTKIVASLLFLSVTFPAIIMAAEPAGDNTIVDEGYNSATSHKVDSWMVDLSSWVSGSKTNLTEREEAVSVEKWMVRPDRSWGDSYGESSIQLESWMIDIQHSNWDKEQAEPELILESWMYDLASWATS